MKTTKILKLSLLTIGTIMFTIIFWKQHLGINILIFTVFVELILIFLNKELIKNKEIIISLSGTLLTSLLIVYHNSLYAKIMYFISFIVLIGYINEPRIKLISNAIIESIGAFFKAFKPMKKELISGTKPAKTFNQILRFGKIALIPILILILFYIIYKFANPIFMEYANSIQKKLAMFFSTLFKDFPLLRVLFTLWGFVIFVWIIFRNNYMSMYNAEKKYTNTILRKRKKRNFNYRIKHAKLKNEFRSALMLLLLVNILILIVNIIDIEWIWFNFKYQKSFDMRQLVHEGTYLLIISILLSISILLIFFRNYLNFYSKNKLIKILAYIWIFQNGIMTISVLLRNFHYITYFGLAYKRIGVIVFLVLVIIGLISLYIKIKHKKTGYYLFKINGLALYIVLILSTIPDWDIIIAKTNLKHPLRNNMETSFLLSLSDKTIPLIHQNEYVLKQPTEYNVYKKYNRPYTEEFEIKVNSFKYRNKLLSWNFTNYKTYKYLKNNDIYKSKKYKVNKNLRYLKMKYFKDQSPTYYLKSKPNEAIRVDTIKDER